MVPESAKHTINIGQNMQITTKFNVNDIVYIYKTTELLTKKIVEVNITVGKKAYDIEIKYYCNQLDGDMYTWFKEDDLSTDKVQIATKLLANLGFTAELKELI